MKVEKKYAWLCSLLISFFGWVGCTAETDEVKEPTEVTFQLTMEVASRAAQSLSLDAYAVKLYLYKEVTRGTVVDYTFVKEVALDKMNFVDGKITVDGLLKGTNYKAVFLARSLGETPELPSPTESYRNATAAYIDGTLNGGICKETNKNIFRSIVSFQAGTQGTLSTILTRQNGALQVRIRNKKKMEKVELRVNGHTTMYLHDGTGGQVLTKGETVPLYTELTTQLDEPEVRIRIHLLPQENIKDVSGTQNYLQITTIDGSVTKYPLKSEHNEIPIYPNQVTWLTLGGGSAGSDFDVSFSGNINLEEDIWDGWNDNF